VTQSAGGTLQVRIQLYNCVAVATRYAQSICTVTGTDLIAWKF
jgi:hypothetical protein